MPTNVAGFVLLVVLALPGYVYTRAVDRHVPKRVHTAFMELISIFFASVAIDGVTLALLETGERLGLWYGPSFNGLLLRPGKYATEHFTATVLWSAVAVALACSIAYAAGAGQWQRLLPAPWQRRWRERNRRLEPQHSAWWLLFREHPDTDVHLGCVLDDGGYLGGKLHSYSRVPTEHGDRELTLSGDISYRPPGGETADVLPQVNAVAVSSRRLTFLTVSYVERPGGPATTPATNTADTGDPAPSGAPDARPEPPADPEPAPSVRTVPGSREP